MFYSISIQYYLYAKEKKIKEKKTIILYFIRIAFHFLLISLEGSHVIESECHHQNLFVLYYDDDIDTFKIFY